MVGNEFLDCDFVWFRVSMASPTGPTAVDKEQVGFCFFYSFSFRFCKFIAVDRNSIVWIDHIERILDQEGNLCSCSAGFLRIGQIVVMAVRSSKKNSLIELKSLIRQLVFKHWSFIFCFNLSCSELCPFRVMNVFD